MTTNIDKLGLQINDRKRKREESVIRISRKMDDINIVVISIIILVFFSFFHFHFHFQCN